MTRLVLPRASTGVDAPMSLADLQDAPQFATESTGAEAVTSVDLAAHTDDSQSNPGASAQVKASVEDGAVLKLERYESEGDSSIDVTADGGAVTVAVQGDFIFVLPTSDPAVTGAWWNDSGTVKISAGGG